MLVQDRSFAQRILVLFAHPALEESRANRLLITAVKDLPGVTFHDLYEAYPDFGIDVEREQQLVEAHDILILQHPLFWYSTPSLVKEWQDLVLEHGWAYGLSGKALVGKKLLQVITTGARESAYHEDGMNRFTLRQLLAPIEQTAVLCKMEYLPPFVVHGTHQMSARAVEQHTADYRQLVEALRVGTVDFAAAHRQPRINTDLGAVLRDRGIRHAQ